MPKKIPDNLPYRLQIIDGNVISIERYPTHTFVVIDQEYEDSIYETESKIEISNEDAKILIDDLLWNELEPGGDIFDGYRSYPRIRFFLPRGDRMAIAWDVMDMVEDYGKGFYPRWWYNGKGYTTYREAKDAAIDDS